MDGSQYHDAVALRVGLDTVESDPKDPPDHRVIVLTAFHNSISGCENTYAVALGCSTELNRLSHHRATTGQILVCPPILKTYAVNELPQPQLPVAFGLLKVKPEPITPLT